ALRAQLRLRPRPAAVQLPRWLPERDVRPLLLERPAFGREHRRDPVRALTAPQRSSTVFLAAYSSYASVWRVESFLCRSASMTARASCRSVSRGIPASTARLRIQ